MADLRGGLTFVQNEEFAVAVTDCFTNTTMHFPVITHGLGDQNQKGTRLLEPKTELSLLHFDRVLT